MAKSAFIVVIFAIIIATYSDTIFRKEYIVHTNGGVLISGASTGIGRHAAETIAKETKYVVYAGVRTDSDAKSINNMNIDTLIPVKLDVTIQDSINEAYEFITKDMENRGENFKLISLINNAGYSHFSPVEFDYDMRKIFEVNFFGMLSLTQKFMPLIRKSSGRIINISSILSKTPYQCSGAYGATKRAMEAISDSLRIEASNFGISVSYINPGYVQSAIHSKERILSNKNDSSEVKKVYFFLYEEGANKGYLKGMEKADPPIVTSVAIMDALKSRFPKTKYFVANILGIPTNYFAAVVSFLPDRIYDKILGTSIVC